MVVGSSNISTEDSKQVTEEAHLLTELEEQNSIPQSMAECLDADDPVAALNLLAKASALRASQKAHTLQREMDKLDYSIPHLLTTFRNDNPDHPLVTVTACADSVHGSLTKIASGGSQASQEILQLEQEKRDLDQHADAVQMAILLRKQSERAAQSLSASAWLDAAEAVQPWLEWNDKQKVKNSNKNNKQKDNDDHHDQPDPRVRKYAGEYSISQLQTTYEKLKDNLLQQYETAVEKSDLHVLGQLTPILTILRLENEGVRLYTVYLKSILDRSLPEAAAQIKKEKQQPPYAPMGRVYNTSVSTLRHHLPMVSHCLYKADGAVAVVQLVHVKTEDHVLPLLQKYQRDRQLVHVARLATQIYSHLEERYTGRHHLVDDGNDGGDDDDTSLSDCGFASQIGTLADVDASMEETALCIQHAESYMRFIQHTISEVNRARELRHNHEMERLRMERERREWTTGKKTKASSSSSEKNADNMVVEYEPIEILPSSTPLQEAIAELGGQYAAIERCLLLASMQRAFAIPYDDAKYYQPMSISSSSSSTLPSSSPHGSKDKNEPLQTTLVETCLYAARRGMQRAFATGHTGTASAMTNFGVECLTDVLLEVLTRRAEDMGVHPLRPGEGLLVGSANLFNNASNLIRQGGGAVGVAPPSKTKEELMRKQKREKEIAQACAMMNDVEVAIRHTQQLQALLNRSIDQGFPANTHATEQLRMCVKSLESVAESFRIASSSTIESLESVLKQRIRSIVGDAVGSEGTSSTFMGASSVMGGSTSDQTMVRMNYKLDEETYNLLQLSEGYVDRLCGLLDELLAPLRRYLAPSLWDALLLSVLNTAGKRLETSLRKCEFTSLGGLALDSDMRDLLHYTKDNLYSTEYGSNAAIFKACPALARLTQIGKLMSVDDLEDIQDVITSAKRKGGWEMKTEEVKAFLCARVEFDESRVAGIVG